MHTNNSYIKIIRKQKEKPQGFQPKAKSNKPKRNQAKRDWQ